MLEAASLNENLISAITGLAETIDPKLDKQIKEIKRLYCKLNNHCSLEADKTLNEDSKTLNTIVKLREQNKPPYLPIDSLTEIQKTFNKTSSTYSKSLRTASTQEEIECIFDEYELKTQRNSSNLKIAILTAGTVLTALDNATQVLEQRKREEDYPHNLKKFSPERKGLPPSDESKEREGNISSTELAEIRNKYKEYRQTKQQQPTNETTESLSSLGAVCWETSPHRS